MTGREIREDRERLGFTQAQYGKLLGGARWSTVSRWENGHTPIPERVQLRVRGGRMGQQIEDLQRKAEAGTATAKELDALVQALGHMIGKNMSLRAVCKDRHPQRRLNRLALYRIILAETLEVSERAIVRMLGSSWPRTRKARA